MNTSLITKIFFQQLALEPNWFSIKMPIKTQILVKKEESDFYEDLIERENQKFDESKLEVNYYYFTSYGVVINDGKINWLFSDEKTLYLISKHVGFDKNSTQLEAVYYNLDVPYFINETYSTSYLFSLMNHLISSDHKYFIPEDDERYRIKLESMLKV